MTHHQSLGRALVDSPSKTPWEKGEPNVGIAGAFFTGRRKQEKAGPLSK
jgi:hypothetical protein